MNNKIVTISDLTALRSQFSNKKIIFVSGCFDIFHIGHIRFLKAAKKEADVLVVAVLSDSFVQYRKGLHRPIFPQVERVELISDLSVADYVFVLDKESTELSVKNLQPDYYGVGGDRKGKKLPEADILQRYNVGIKYLPQFGEMSTSSIIQAIKDYF